MDLVCQSVISVTFSEGWMRRQVVTAESAPWMKSAGYGRESSCVAAAVMRGTVVLLREVRISFLRLSERGRRDKGQGTEGKRGKAAVRLSRIVVHFWFAAGPVWDRGAYRFTELQSYRVFREKFSIFDDFNRINK
jgi:hypothetical protein